MKKLIGILLVFCMLQGFTEVFAAEEKAADCQAVMLFKTLGITDDEFKSEEYMTRAEFTALTVRAMGKDNMPAGEVSYKDVSPEDTYYNEIAIADTLGIISKSDTFEPDKPITYEEAAKILVCMLGYEYPAGQKGGYALGYISMANDKKLFDNLLFRMGANAIFLDTNLKNTRAQHVYEKLGFRKTAVHHDSWKNQIGELESSVDYELTADAFCNLKERL